jgi:hypothetical protein
MTIGEIVYILLKVLLLTLVLWVVGVPERDLGWCAVVMATVFILFAYIEQLQSHMAQKEREQQHTPMPTPIGQYRMTREEVIAKLNSLDAYPGHCDMTPEEWAAHARAAAAYRIHDFLRRTATRMLPGLGGRWTGESSPKCFLVDVLCPSSHLFR